MNLSPVHGTRYEVTADGVRIRYATSWAGLKAWFRLHYCPHLNQQQDMQRLKTLRGTSTLIICRGCGFVRLVDKKHYGNMTTDYTGARHTLHEVEPWEAVGDDRPVDHETTKILLVKTCKECGKQSEDVHPCIDCETLVCESCQETEHEPCVIAFGERAEYEQSQED